MRKVTISVPCYNEVQNAEPMARAIINEMDKLPQYDYEILFIDNYSTDGTQDVLRGLAKKNSRIKVVMNSRNYGPLRSPRNGNLYATGEAVLGIACDFQDPPELIPEFLKYWEEGYVAVYGQKVTSKEGIIKHGLRTLYYNIIDFFSDVPQYKHISGISLNEKWILEQLSELDDMTPGRNLIADLGYEIKLIPYTQQKRKSGKSSYNVWRYLDFAITSLVSTSIAPLRIATVLGIIFSGISFIIGIVYLVYKLIYWDRFLAGMAPLTIGLFFLGSVQLLFIGLVGEYVGIILKKVTKKPPVMVKELINIDNEMENKNG